MAAKDVAEATTGEVLVLDDDLLSEGTGLEDLGTDDYALPFIRVIQSNSPQLKSTEATKYIPEAKEGMLVNTLTNQVHAGEQGVAVIPCAYTKKYIEWVPLGSGGGFVRDDHPASILGECKKNDSRQFILPNGNEIQETAQYFLLLVEDEARPEQVLLSCTSTQLTFARRWNTMLRTATVDNAAGESVLAPMFAYVYRLSTGLLSNNMGSWHGLSVNLEKHTPLPLARVARDFMVAARAGDVNVKQEAAADGEDIPF